ncbi:MAG: beta-lactamase family protein [Candidatus Aminicenantes bacterium]|nr:beta-lactamase family protein [Candidatus Aminicenantes bacterium]
MTESLSFHTRSSRRLGDLPLAILIPALGGCLLLLLGSLAAGAVPGKDIQTGRTSAGPAALNAPDSLWRIDFFRSIAGDLSSDFQKVLDQALEGILSHAPGASVAVGVPGRGTWSATRGLAVTRPPMKMTTDAAFQAASITKLFTSAAVMQLVDEGRLRLDDRVIRWYPDVPNAADMTIEHLLGHTCGLVSFNILPSLGGEYRTPDEVIRLAAAEPPLFKPGTNWAYTNTGYALLGRIIEKIEGKPLAEILARRITKPLSLDRTILRHPGDGFSIVGGHASGKPVAVRDGYATAYAAGALASTAPDLVRFWRAFLAGELFSKARLKTMFSRMRAMDPGGRMYYGQGVQMYDIPDGPGLMFGHSGGITGFTSIVAYIPKDDIFVAVLFNDKDVAAEAGLWALVRAVRGFREAGTP